MTLTIVSLLPWQCISNPSGYSTMQTQPGVICFSSDEHSLLLGLSVLGLLMRLRPQAPPKPMFLGIRYRCLRCPSEPQRLAFHISKLYRYEVMYPSYVASGQGLIIVNRYRFIFERFRASRYFFGVLYLLRNTLLSLIPVALANYPSIQITTLAGVMLMGMIVQMRSWPWRTKAAKSSLRVE